MENVVSTSFSTAMAPEYNVFPIPFTSPHDGGRSVEIDPSIVEASPFGWHDVDGAVGADFTVTRGNNVNAYEDGDNPGFQPDGGANLVFDFPFDPVYGAVQSEEAAITNLFYWNNIIHDILYLNGFDEASGNFQQNNYGNGGVPGDAVNAEAQDNSGSCNANFATPPDGFQPRMQMYTCGSRDGDFDNLVIVHEYGHGISNRLTGGGSNTDCLFNDEQMGEGWSDWYGTVFTIQPGDTGTDPVPVGNWLFEQDPNGPGIRDFPYSTDMSVDPRTYDYIKGTFGPHPLGSTWAAMLWELTWGLIDAHGFDPDIYNGNGGNNIAVALVTEGLKLQPCNPGFVDGRDAILAADMALYGGANQCIIWDAFAKRGLGFSADQGSSHSRTDGTEAFDTPSTTLATPAEPFCVVDSPVTLDGGSPAGGVYSGPGVTDNGDGITYTFDPAIAGIGLHTITFVATSTCGGGDTATSEIEVKSEFPEIICQDITISLDAGGQATIVPQDVVTNFLPSDGYTLDQSGTFNPEDISGTGTEVFLSDDDVSTDLPIGFDFVFYGNTYSTFKISSNGFLVFGNTSSGSGCCSGGNIPANDGINNMIAFAWDDLYPPGNGEVRYSTIGSAPNRILVMDFDAIPFCCNNTAKVTTQVKLFENSNRIEIHSTDVEGSPMTQGIENEFGTDGIAVPGRNSQTFAIANDFVAFVPNTGSFPDNCGNPVTVTLDIDSFDCSNLGENTVTATATDSMGNSASCTAIVTVESNLEVTFALDGASEFCVDQDSFTMLGGGLPEGGTYSGLGVIDNGDGQTFTFNPEVAGVGVHDITYTGGNSCGTTGSETISVEVQSAIPEIQCEDTTVFLDENGTATISWEQLLGIGAGAGSGVSTFYALNPFDSNNSIARFDYDVTNGGITVDSNYGYSTGSNRNFALDRDPGTGIVYYVGAITSSSPRNLFQLDLEDPTSPPVLITELQSVDGSTNAQSMAFSNDGRLFVLFQSGEINIYDIDTDTMSPFTTVPTGGSVGLGYNLDTDKLLYTQNNGPVTIYEIDTDSGIVTELFDFFTPGNRNDCSAQAVEYIGNDTIICSATTGCDILYTVNLTTQETSLIVQPSGLFPDVKALMLSSAVPVDNCSGEPLTFEVSQDTFGCSDIGENIVTVTATDGSGNTTQCQATVTVADTLAPTLDCKSTFEVTLDASGTAVVTIDDLLNSPVTDNCDTEPTVTLSRTTLDCSDLAVSNEVLITITATDENSNTETCLVTVTINDPQNVCLLSIEEPFFEDISLYPSPATGSFYVSSTEVGIENILVYNILGQNVLDKQFDGSLQEIEIDATSLANGMYMVIISSKEHSTIKKLIIE
jgi:hypothetical protein